MTLADQYLITDAIAQHTCRRALTDCDGDARDVIAFWMLAVLTEERRAEMVAVTAKWGLTGWKRLMSLRGRLTTAEWVALREALEKQP